MRLKALLDKTNNQMIKLFREIRYDLMEKNKTGKYFKYAIGEIVLVVIGILIALSINNWNEDRKDSEMKNNALDELKHDLTKSLEDIEQNLGNQKDFLESAWRIKKHLVTSSVFADSLGNDLLRMTRDEFLIPVSKTYSAIKSAGFKIITNDSIRMETNRVYEVLFSRIIKVTSHEPDIEAYFTEYIQQNFSIISTDTLYQSSPDIETLTTRELWSLGNGFNSKYIPIDYNHFRTDPEFSILYDKSTRWRMKKIMRYKLARDAVKNLIRLIEENGATK